MITKDTKRPHDRLISNAAILMGLLLIFPIWLIGGWAVWANDPEYPISVDLGIYTPGVIPAGIGEPVKEARDVADEWEEMKPGRKIKFQQIVLSGGGEGEWLKTQLLGGIAPEILAQNAEVAWQDTDKDWYIALDEYLERPNPYIPGNKRWIDSFVNQDLVQAKRAPNGKLYCISIDIVETGLYLNLDLLDSIFAESGGFEGIPETWDEWIEMLVYIRDNTKLVPMAAGVDRIGSDWGQDILFEMIYHDILPQMDLIPSATSAEGYLGHYLEAQEIGFLASKGFFTSRDPRWREMNRILYDWRQCWGKELKNTDAMRLFLTQRTPILWDGSWSIRRMQLDPYINDPENYPESSFRWGIGYLPALTSATSRFAKGTPATVIGGAAVQLHITNSARHKNTVEECVDFLMYLSAPPQLQRLTNEALLFIPNVQGVAMSKELEPFAEIFKRRYCAVKWLESMDGIYKKHWRRMLDYYLNDGFGLDAYLSELDGNFAGWVEQHRGEGGWDFAGMEEVWASRSAFLQQQLDAPEVK